ncbi:hypothetical protein P4S54_14865 [Shewanella sp. PP-He15 brown]
MQFFEYSKLRESIIALSRKGSSFSKAADRADSLIGKVAREDEEPLRGLQKTLHGESRIKNCIKYDLCGRSRLVTVQSNGNCLLLFVGDHNTVDKWLDANKGMTFALNKVNQFVEIQSNSSVIGESTPFIEHRYRQDKFLVELLDNELADRFLGLAPRPLQKSLIILSHLMNTLCTK